jgi:hypothetical protein
MLGGIFHHAGYFMGDALYEGNPSNPKGFFENGLVNDTNELILAPYNKRFLPYYLYKFLRIPKPNPKRRQQWLYSTPPDREISFCNNIIKSNILSLTQRSSFCYKDPRFSYTLPVWSPYFSPDTRFICVFRRPNVTVESILKECSTRDYLRSLFIDAEYAYSVYINIYSHIFKNMVGSEERFFFVHYEQILSGEFTASLSEFVNAPLSAAFADKALKRSKSSRHIPKKALTVYTTLCQLAGFKDPLINETS